MFEISVLSFVNCQLLSINEGLKTLSTFLISQSSISDCHIKRLYFDDDSIACFISVVKWSQGQFCNIIEINTAIIPSKST